MFYVGNTFDKKVNKGYKTIKNAKKEAGQRFMNSVDISPARAQSGYRNCRRGGRGRNGRCPR